MYRDYQKPPKPRFKVTGMFVGGVVLIALGVIPTLLLGFVLVMTLSAATQPNPGMHMMGASVGYMFTSIIFPLAVISFGLMGSGIYCLRVWRRRSTTQPFAKSQRQVQPFDDKRN